VTLEKKVKDSVPSCAKKLFELSDNSLTDLLHCATYLELNNLQELFAALIAFSH
jgi:hypothetical protein